MSSLQTIKSRLKAVDNVGQITKAMEVVAATKMRKSQEAALRSRPYAYKALEILERIGHYAPLITPLSQKREIKSTLVVIMASDKGLIGAFNAQVFRFADRFFREDKYKDKSGHKYQVLAIGRKAGAYASQNGLNIAEGFEGFGDYIDPSEVSPLSSLLIEGYEKGRWDRVAAISTHFRTTLKQEVVRRQILPVDFKKIRETVHNIIPERGRYSDIGGKEKGGLSIEAEPAGHGVDYIFEPTPKEALDLLIPHLISMQLYHLVLEANASEHSARRVAMKNASDNAKEISDALTLEFNKARQAGITGELIEITSTLNAL